MKIGIFAGTFDPIHSGHIAFARSAIEKAGLEEVIIVAEKEPYRKKPHASWDHRQAMIERATEDLARVDHDYKFAAELAHQHTMRNLLATAERHYGAGNEFWFLVGSDIYEHIHKWKDIAADHEYGGFVIALRDDHTTEWLADKQAKANHLGISSSVVMIENDHPHVSSSKIRSIFKECQVPEYMSKNVIDYAREHTLYQ